MTNEIEDDSHIPRDAKDYLGSALHYVNRYSQQQYNLCENDKRKLKELCLDYVELLTLLDMATDIKTTLENLKSKYSYAVIPDRLTEEGLKNIKLDGIGTVTRVNKVEIKPDFSSEENVESIELLIGKLPIKNQYDSALVSKLLKEKYDNGIDISATNANVSTTTYIQLKRENKKGENDE